MKTEQLAINSTSTRQAPIDEAIRAYADVGFKNVEIQMPQLKDWLKQGHSVDEFASLLDKLGMNFIGGLETVIVAFAEPAVCKEHHDIHIENAKIMADLGGGVMVMGADGPDEGADVFPAFEKTGKACADLAEEIDPSVTLAIEFNWSVYVLSLRSVKRVVDAADHPRVGILFDPAHYFCTTSKMEDLTPDTVAKILHVHADDMQDKPGEHSHCNADRALPGQGSMNLPLLLGRIEEYGYKGYFSIEMFSKDLNALPAKEAARLMYDSMLWLQDAV